MLCFLVNNGRKTFGATPRMVEMAKTSKVDLRCGGYKRDYDCDKAKCCAAAPGGRAPGPVSPHSGQAYCGRGFAQVAHDRVVSRLVDALLLLLARPTKSDHVPLRRSRAARSADRCISSAEQASARSWRPCFLNSSHRTLACTVAAVAKKMARTANPMRKRILASLRCKIAP